MIPCRQKIRLSTVVVADNLTFISTLLNESKGKALRYTANICMVVQHLTGGSCCYPSWTRAYSRRRVEPNLFIVPKISLGIYECMGFKLLCSTSLKQVAKQDAKFHQLVAKCVLSCESSTYIPFWFCSDMSFSPTYPSAVEVPFGVLQQITQMNDNFISKEMS